MGESSYALALMPDGSRAFVGMGRAFACVVACAASSGCASSPAMHAAERSDPGARVALRDAIASRESAGTLSNGEAASIAVRVARRDLLMASPAEARARVRDALPCARELDDALADRMQVHDDAGADAALARIAGRGLSFDDARAFFTSEDPQWRAVGARGLVRVEDREARLSALADAAPAVRRQAARASHDAADGADLTLLAAAARLDPEPIVRTEAVRAIAAMGPGRAGEAVDALRDLWTTGDDGLREDIALAWASPTLWDAGGREALRVLGASGHGPGAIEAAAAVLRHPPVRSASGDNPASGDEVIDAAIGQLARAMSSGSRATRLQALAEAPLDRPDLLEATRAAAVGDDLEVRVGALSRLASLRVAKATNGNDEGARAVAALEALAQPGSPVAQRARFALAVAGDRRVQSWIEADLTATEPEDRLDAATALASLGVAGRAAPLLADSDASVRVRSACTLVMAARVAR